MVNQVFYLYHLLILFKIVKYSFIFYILRVFFFIFYNLRDIWEVTRKEVQIIVFMFTIVYIYDECAKSRDLSGNVIILILGTWVEWVMLAKTIIIWVCLLHGSCRSSFLCMSQKSLCCLKLFAWVKLIYVGQTFLCGSNYFCVDQVLFWVHKISWWRSGSLYYSLFGIPIFQKVTQVCEIGTSVLIKEKYPLQSNTSNPKNTFNIPRIPQSL